MHFAYPFPWWLAVLVAAAVAFVAFKAYRRPLALLTPVQRGLLSGLRALTLAVLVLFLFRPVVLLPPATSRGAIVPVLVDVSRSMRLADADGQPRIVRASSLLTTKILPALSQFDVALHAVGDGVAPATPDRLHADARRSDLAAALDAVRERYRSQSVSGIVIVSDGGDTSQQTAAASGSGPPVFAIGIGAADGVPDREIVGMTTGDPKLDQASVDLRISAVSYGFGREPFQLRILANGVIVETRRIAPEGDGSPIDELFTVSPDPVTPTIFAAEIPAAEGEAVVENNTRSVLVSPAGRKRRLLVIEGAPGFEHSFLKRALTIDPGLEIDAITRKGKNAEGQDTFLVQAGSGRASALSSGFPTRREDLYAYDAIVIANVEGDFYTRAQLSMVADFVAERGGGLLALGGRSFAQRGLMATPLEVALPLELNDRRGILQTSLREAGAPNNKLVVTAEGENHPIMRLGSTRDQTNRLWAALPALAGSAPLGGPRPGAMVLAVAAAAGGGVFPVVAVQRFGQGRSMIFAGEASWRWKMMLPSTDRTYELFWRQAARWLAGSAPDPVAITVPDAPEPGDTLS
ncbi:MAG: VWA domain-containing protein, partial [Acidobacteria bacterium]|nr:VWA domain-containing protein [Acidobacteriota bacterium]